MIGCLQIENCYVLGARNTVDASFQARRRSCLPGRVLLTMAVSSTVVSSTQNRGRPSLRITRGTGDPHGLRRCSRRPLRFYSRHNHRLRLASTDWYGKVFFPNRFVSGFRGNSASPIVHLPNSSVDKQKTDGYLAETSKACERFLCQRRLPFRRRLPSEGPAIRT